MSVVFLILFQHLLQDMKSKGLVPNLGTFNAVLETLGFMPNNRNAKTYALQILSEMRQLQIEPSLASFYHLLNTFYGGIFSFVLLSFIRNCLYE